MSDLVRVETVRAHENVFGRKREKEPGDKYRLPLAQAENLQGQGLVKLLDEKGVDTAAEPGAAPEQPAP